MYSPAFWFVASLDLRSSLDEAGEDSQCADEQTFGLGSVAICLSSSDDPSVLRWLLRTVLRDGEQPGQRELTSWAELAVKKR